MYVKDFTLFVTSLYMSNFMIVKNFYSYVLEIEKKVKRIEKEVCIQVLIRQYLTVKIVPNLWEYVVLGIDIKCHQ